MKWLLILGLIIITIAPQNSTAQSNPRWKEHDGFNSVFQHLVTGKFEGTANGVLFVKKGSNANEIILDFQGGKAELSIQRDEHEIYDVSTKVYQGFTTSGKSSIKYETYAWANAISILINNEWYRLSLIDGACDMAINGIEFLYKAEMSAEYLVLRVSKELTLFHRPYDQEKIETTKKPSEKKSLILLPESTIIFALKR